MSTSSGARSSDARRAVVIGGDADIGPACARTLAARGWHVMVIGDDPSAVCDEIVGLAGTAVGERAGPGDVDEVEAIARRCADRWSSVHALVNCQMAAEAGSVEELTMASWERALRINLTAPLMATKAFLPLLAAAGGAAVVHLGSVDGQQGNPRVPAYSVAKGGLVAMTHVMAHELAGRAIRVNCVARALVASGGASGGLPGGLALEALIANTPLGRAARPDEIASVVAFLVSEDSAYMTGAVVTVDGGRTGITPGTG